ncbi:MAG TPA: CdaR family protein [Acidobacteriota bacterium]|nr:CdaR family protein [Acidobacteriota bacterium]
MINWRDWITNNAGLKLVSLLLATLLWFQVASRQIVERDISMPVEYVNLPDNLAIANDPPRQVDARVRSPRNLTGDDLSAMVMSIDLRDADVGRRTERLPPVVNKPRDLQVLQLSRPTLIEILIEPKVERLLPVDPQWEGQPADTFLLVEIVASPARATVSGPRSAVETVENVKTVPIDIAGRTESFVVRKELLVEQERVRVIEESALLRVHIEEERRPVTLTGIKVEIIPPDPNARLRSETISVEGSVPVSFQGEIDATIFQAVVSTQNLQPQRSYQELVPRVVIPERYAMFRISEVESVEVRKTQ